MNPQSSSHRERLSKALSRSYESLAPFRRSRRELIEDFAGSRYGTDGYEAKPETYVNLMQIAVESYKVSLSYNEPRVLITSDDSELLPFANRFQVALNNYARKIHLGDSIREIITDAVFMVGIGKTYLKDSPEVYHENDVYMDPGVPYFGRVSFDDWVHDVSKSDFRRAQFYGNRYSMDLEQAKTCPYFNKKVREELEATRLSERSEQGDRASDLTNSIANEDAEIEDVVDLIDIYLPKEKLVCTWPAWNAFDIASTPPLAVLDWDGAETGPYRFLSFLDVPDNIMPTSPAQSLCALFYLYNFLMRKIARRAKQQKDVLPYEAGAGDDMSRAMLAEDMQTVKVNRLQSINVLRFPGPDQGLNSFTYGLQEIFNQAAGNFKTALGLAPSAGTVGQEQILNQNAGARIAESRRRVDRFVGEVFKDVGWLLYDDPMLEIPGQIEIPGAGITVPADWGPPDQLERPASFDRFSVVFEAGSMEYRSSEARLAGLQQDLQVLGPMIPLAQQQGLEFQFQEVVNDISDLRAEPRIKRWFRMAQPREPQEGGPSMRPPGTGQYTRTSVSEKTGDGQLQALMQQQPSEPVGMAM